MENIHSFWLWWQEHISKNLEQGNVYHCVASPLLLKTYCKTSGVLLGFYERNVVTSCLIQDLSCSGQLDPDSPPVNPCCCHVSSMWFSFVLLKYARPSLRRCCLDGSICCSKISVHSSALMEHVHPIRTNATPQASTAHAQLCYHDSDFSSHMPGRA